MNTIDFDTKKSKRRWRRAQSKVNPDVPPHFQITARLIRWVSQRPRTRLGVYFFGSCLLSHEKMKSFWKKSLSRRRFGTTSLIFNVVIFCRKLVARSRISQLRQLS